MRDVTRNQERLRGYVRRPLRGNPFHMCMPQQLCIGRGLHTEVRIHGQMERLRLW
ncbi:hypothetical protein DPMN_069286 [Dreissena polymorpha]|uniref:Uncharacterized protein n=1 Tax=Dreissena polymorpha TaxID=45954 RepID=A0A9D3Z379_DREPO|nr:hypothetical protein DPMN_069286 [Dreissena polymorpha]